MANFMYPLQRISSPTLDEDQSWMITVGEGGVRDKLNFSPRLLPALRQHTIYEHQTFAWARVINQFRDFCGGI